MKTKIAQAALLFAALAVCVLVLYFTATPVGDGGRVKGMNNATTTAAGAKPTESEVVKGPAGKLKESVNAAPGKIDEHGANRMAQREGSLRDPQFQAAAKELMLSSVKRIVANVPVFGNSGLLTNEYRVASQLWGDDVESTLETADRTRYLLDHGAVRKIEVLSILPQAVQEPDATPAQRQAAMAALRNAPDKNWTDDEVRQQFRSIATFFGLTPEELAAELKVDRTKVSAAQPLQRNGAPPVPASTAKPGTDAFVTVTLSDPTDRDVALFRVRFRTEVTGSGFRLAVAELINQNFKLADPAFSELGKRFR